MRVAFLGAARTVTGSPHLLSINGHPLLLGFDLLTYVGSIEESREIDQRDEPMVIVSASGMIESWLRPPFLFKE